MYTVPTDDDFERFIAEERGALARFTRRLTKNADWSEDLMQKAFASFWEDREAIYAGAIKLSRQKDVEHPWQVGVRAWLRRVIHNAVRDEAKRGSTHDTGLDENINPDALLPEVQPVNAQVLSITSLYTDFLTQLYQNSDLSVRFRALAAAYVRLDGYTYEETVGLMTEEASELLSGYSDKLPAQISRVEAAVKRIDADFMKWLYGGP